MAEIEEIGFDKVVETRRKKKIYPFVEAYCGFHEEFANIIPQAKDIEKYTRILWEIFCYHLRYEGTGVIISGHNIDSPYLLTLK